MTLIDHLNKWLTALQAIAAIGGVVVALYQLNEIRVQTALQSRTLKTEHANQSANLILKLRDVLDAAKYAKVTDAIQAHDQQAARNVP